MRSPGGERRRPDIAPGAGDPRRPKARPQKRARAFGRHKCERSQRTAALRRHETRQPKSPGAVLKFFSVSKRSHDVPFDAARGAWRYCAPFCAVQRTCNRLRLAQSCSSAGQSTSSNRRTCHMNMMTPDRFLRLNSVLDRTGPSRARLYRRSRPEPSRHRSASLRSAATGGRAP
jgi:hypothetical protein